MNRRLGLALLALGPVCVGLLRFLLPYYTAADSRASAVAVMAHPGRESAVLWLGLVATLSLVPGVYAVRGALPANRLRATALTLLVAGYLALPLLLAPDLLLWLGADQGLSVDAVAQLLDGVHPAFVVGLGVFVVGHVLGVVLLGVACLRARVLPTALAWVLLLSQPVHFLTAVFLGLPWLDLLAWTATAAGMVALGLAALSQQEQDAARAPVASLSGR